MIPVSNGAYISGQSDVYIYIYINILVRTRHALKIEPIQLHLSPAATPRHSTTVDSGRKRKHRLDTTRDTQTAPTFPDMGAYHYLGQKYKQRLDVNNEDQPFPAGVIGHQKTTYWTCNIKPTTIKQTSSQQHTQRKAPFPPRGKHTSKTALHPPEKKATSTPTQTPYIPKYYQVYRKPRRFDHFLSDRPLHKKTIMLKGESREPSTRPTKTSNEKILRTTLVGSVISQCSIM